MKLPSNILNRSYKGLATESIILTFVKCFSYASSMIQAMILSRAFSKLEYGTFSQGNLIVTFFAPFFLLGLSNAANYFYNQGNDKKDVIVIKSINSIFTIILVLGSLGGLLLIILHNQIAAYFSNPTLLPIIYIVAFRPLFQNLISFFQVLYVSSGKVRIIAIRNSIISIFQLIIAIIAAYLFRSVRMVLLLLVITDLIQLVIFHLYFNYMEFHISVIIPSFPTIKIIMKYALPLALSTAVGTLSINMDTMMIGRMMTTEDFALYSNMAKELPFNLMISSFATVIYPRIVSLTANGQKAKMLETYKLYVEIGLLSTWILVFGAIVCAKELVLFLYSEKYVEGVPIFVIYLFVSALRFTYYGTLLTANGDTQSIFKYSVLSLVCNFILNVVLFYAIGVIGPALATFITVFATGYLQMRKGLSIIHSKFVNIFDFKFIIKFIISSTLICLVLFYLKSSIAFLPVFPRLIVFYLLVIGSLVFLNKRRLMTDIKALNRQ